MKKIIVYLIIVLSCSQKAYNQIKLTIQDCEKAFLANNLELLSNYYNIKIAQGALQQSKTWELPVFNTTLNLINPDSNKIFDIGKKGQKAFSVSQLIYLGKKKKEILYAQSNIELKKIELSDLLRNLNLELRQTFYEIYFEEQKLNALKTQITHVDTLVKRYVVQVDKGNIALKEQVRLQTLIFNLKSENMVIEKGLVELRSRLSILTGLDSTITPLLDVEPMIKKILIQEEASINDLLDQAYKNRSDYLLYNEKIKNAEYFLKWQKSLSIPDINLGLAYDQGAGAFKNETNLTLTIPLPLWNKNKGNIKIANYQIAQAISERDKKKQEIYNEVKKNYTQWQNAKQLYAFLQTTNENQFEFVYHGMFNNFEKRNISIFEFTDYIESYKQSILQINEIKKQLFISIENIHFAIQKQSLVYEK